MSSGHTNLTSTPLRSSAPRKSHQPVSEALKIGDWKALPLATATNFLSSLSKPSRSGSFGNSAKSHPSSEFGSSVIDTSSQASGFQRFRMIQMKNARRVCAPLSVSAQVERTLAVGVGFEPTRGLHP